MAREISTTRPVSLPSRLFRGALWLLFALVLLVPKLIAFRRRRRIWNILRVILAVAGAALIAVHVVSHAGMVFAVLGAALLLIALVVRSEQPRQSLDDRARQLGALVVVNGGTYQPPRAAPMQVHLCVGADRTWILDTSLSVKLELPLASLSSVQAQLADTGWKLSFLAKDAVTDLFYSGPFAEHFARVAESTVRSQLHRELPVLR